MTNPAPKDKTSGRVVVLLSLGSLAVMSMIGFIVLAATHSAISTEPLTSIMSICVGSMVTYLATENHDEEKSQDSDQDNYERMIGRAATRSMIAEAMRQMGVGGPTQLEHPDPPEEQQGPNP